MISIGLLSIVMSGFAAFMTYQARVNQSTQLDRNWANLLANVTQALRTVNACTTVLGGVAPGTSFAYHDPSGLTFMVGSNVTGLKLTKVDCVSGAAIGPGQQYVNIYLQATKTGSFAGPPIVNQNITGIQVNTSGGYITSCF